LKYARILQSYALKDTRCRFKHDIISDICTQHLSTILRTQFIIISLVRHNEMFTRNAQCRPMYTTSKIVLPLAVASAAGSVSGFLHSDAGFLLLGSVFLLPVAAASQVYCPARPSAT